VIFLLSHQRTYQRAFTLFEVSLSLAIVSFAVISVIMLFPSGIKAQQMARFQVYASAKALEMIDSYNTFPTANPALDVEAPNPWDVSSGRANMSFDLEHRLSSFRFGIMPLPTAIARRLDSDNDEIKAILDAGGHIYYSQPRAATGFADSGLEQSPPNDLQKMVFAVVGSAQSNALTVFPWKAWPYYYPFPSPPAHGTHRKEPGFSEPVGAVETFGGKRGILWEDTGDPDMRVVFHFHRTGQSLPVTSTALDDTDDYGYRAYQRYKTKEAAIRYCQTALWYWKKKLPANTDYRDSVITVKQSFDTADRYDSTLNGKKTNAYRFLAHAMACLTLHFDEGSFGRGAVVIPGGFTHSSVTSDTETVTLKMITRLHESAMNLSALYASTYPYDWSVPRPLNRAIMMDHPLFEYDLFSPPSYGTIAGTAATANPQSAQQWKPMSAQEIKNIGRSLTYSFTNIITSGTSSIFSNSNHFTLTRKFEASERCRELVFWVVDWQSYVDCETAPSAQVDAGRYPRASPRVRVNSSSTTPFSFLHHTQNHVFRDWQLYVFRNPEKPLLFTQDLSNSPTGFNVRNIVIGSDDGVNVNGSTASVGVGYPDVDRMKENDAVWHARAMRVFSGLYGADRNFNLQLDRGNVPQSIRMRATSVARFNYYDLRLPAALR
jgi:hypothetical protein